MKSFYSTYVESPQVSDLAASVRYTSIPSRARVAVYEARGAAPRVVDIEPGPVHEYIEGLASTVHRLAAEQGGDVPYSVIREVSENFIHADFAEPVVSILDSGKTIRFADSGPGIEDKEHAVLPGFTTANSVMKEYIRGVGSGLPLVRDYLGFSGGALVIEDNLGAGAVVTISSGARVPQPLSGFGGADNGPWAHQTTGSSPDSTPTLLDATTADSVVAGPLLTTRQKQVLALVMESGSAGPSLVAKELGIGVSTAYRDLASLEDFALIEADGGKRALTEAGLSYLDGLTSAL